MSGEDSSPHDPADAASSDAVLELDDVQRAALAKTAAATATAPPTDETAGRSVASDGFAAIGEQVAAVLRAAEESARAIIQAAEQDAAALRDEAEMAVVRARADAEQLRKEALAEVSRLHDAARRIEAQLRTAHQSVGQAVEILPGLMRETEPAADASSTDDATADHAG